MSGQLPKTHLSGFDPSTSLRVDPEPVEGSKILYQISVKKRLDEYVAQA